MEIFIAEQCKTLAESCIMGLIFGAGYDIIRILHVLCGIASYSGTAARKPIQKIGRTAFLVFLLGDLLYMLTVTAAASVFLYHANHGQFRLYLALSCIGGFCLYHYTIGRLVMGVSEAVVHLVKWVVYHMVIRPVRWFIGLMCRGIDLVGRLTVGNVRKLLRYWLLTVRMHRRIKQFPSLVRL